MVRGGRLAESAGAGITCAAAVNAVIAVRKKHESSERSLCILGGKWVRFRTLVHAAKKFIAGMQIAK
jgi:hypothetical protein